MFRLVATTFSGAEEVLSKELKALGAGEIKTLSRAVEFTGNTEIMYKANLFCRTAFRILKPFSTFKVNDEIELYKQCKEISWEELMTADDTFAIEAVSSHEKLNHTLYIAQKIKDAIADRFRAKSGKRPSVDLANPRYAIHAYVEKDKCTLSLDSSGGSLHKRGYRISATGAPLNEALAAGLILLSGWEGSTNFYDPMCGSGTFLIEAAMLALNIPSGMYRKGFGFQRWRNFEEELWNGILAKAKSGIKNSLDIKICGADISEGSVRAANINIKNAGLEKFISVEKKSFNDFMPQGESGMVMINPPYGGRLDASPLPATSTPSHRQAGPTPLQRRGELAMSSPREDIGLLYKEIGNHLKKNFTGHVTWILTANREAAKQIGLHSSKKIQVYNGPLECRFMKFELYSGSKKRNEPTE